MSGAGLPDRPAGAARRWRARTIWIVGVAVLATTLVPETAPAGPAARLGATVADRVAAQAGPAAQAGSGAQAASSAQAGCPTRVLPLRYPDVQPIFEQHCAKCHDARLVRNDAAQAVFEMTSYPFSTRRPGTLLDDLRAVFPKRGSLSAAEKCRAQQWLTGGALDAGGKSPVWR